MDITAQLDAGIRFFDLRAGYVGKTLTAFRGNWNLNIPFAMIFQYSYNWLAANPTKAIIAQIKGDQDSAKDQDIPNSVYTMINGNASWVTTATIPTLNQIKGKIQLFRRFPRPDALNNTTTPFGINATNWPFNQHSTISHDNVTLYAQDKCSFPGKGSAALASKTAMIQSFIDTAVASLGPPNAWYIGFSSYTTSGGIPDSNEDYATASLGGNTPMNIALEQFVQSKGGFGKPARVGTLLMDYPEEPTGMLIDRIIYTNNIKPSL
ncbi:PLC-like phosphodiesterase [Dactylonectria macrodidyma]|uniref:PLC-like phosphodiesterase n=1 Tax=Dactylonectria macrodidyma TaxID=307937 RepID=A0A9P9FLG9_9HYPO|nr:PLC-like phosphodiesterase [Dactylonectria macrodidyma]